MLGGGLGLEGMRSAVASTENWSVNAQATHERNNLQEELGVSADDGFNKGVTVSWLLGNGLAEGKGVTASFVLREIEVVSSDGGYLR